MTADIPEPLARRGSLSGMRIALTAAGRAGSARHAALALAVGCAALTVAACAAAPASTVAAARVDKSAKQLAGADAASMLAAFRPPPGAARSGPIAVAPLSLVAEGIAATPDLVDRTAWWRVPGTVHAAVAWITAHRPAGFTFAGWGTLGASGITAASGTFSLPPVAGVILDRSLDVYVARDGADSAAIRVDSEVTWLPPKPPAERIPAAAKVVTITAAPGVDPRTGRPADRSYPPVTVTDPATVARLAAVIDSLPLMPPPGTFASCPYNTGQVVDLTFRATEGGPVLARVTGEMTGCTMVSLVIHGKQMPALWHGNQMDRQVLKLAGIHWPGF
jgi:hypothetical protein